MAMKGPSPVPWRQKPPLPKGAKGARPASTTQVTAKVANIELDVHHAVDSVKMAGSMHTRPYSASIAARPRSHTLVRPSSGHLPSAKPLSGWRSKGRPTSAARKHTQSAGLVAGERRATRPPTGAGSPVADQEAAGAQQEGEKHEWQDSRGVESDDGGVELPIGGLQPPRASLRGGRATFDFSTMPEDELGLGGGAEQGSDSDEGQEQVEKARSGTRVYDKRTGRAAIRTGLAKDTYRTTVQYDGHTFNPFSSESGDSEKAKSKFGFRSKALSLQVGLAERLALETDSDKRFDTMQEAFDQVIRLDINFGDVLRDIKQAYDERVELVASSDGDAVSLAAYEALRNRERIANERAASLQEHVNELRELAAQGDAARRFVQAQGLGDELEKPVTARGTDQSGHLGLSRSSTLEAGEKPAMLSEMERLETLVAQLQGELAAERSEKQELKEALQEVMAHKTALALPLMQTGAGSWGAEAQPSVRDTARSAASGYDDHPTHRSLAQEPTRPAVVPQLTEQEWSLVHQKREEEAAENALYEQGGEVCESTGEEDSERFQPGGYPGGMYAYGDELEEEEEEELMRQYQRQLQDDQRSTGRSEEDALERPALRPASRGGFYPDDGDYALESQRTADEESDEGSEDEQDEVEEEEYSDSDRTMDPRESVASSLMDSARE